MAESENSDEREDAQLVSAERAADDARLLLRKSKNAVLCTISKKIAGWPFGSIAPYALDASGAPVLFISTIAEHTKNLEADDRVSVLVQEESADGEIQAHGRITVVGRAARVKDGDVRDVRARYLERVPSSASYAEAHDFHFYRIVPEHVRFIGGFGKIFWFAPEKLRLDPALDPLAASAAGIIEHMNDDHGEALQLYCRAFKSVTPASAKMIGIDQFGFDVEAKEPDVRLRFDFDRPATHQTVRAIVVEMVARARETLGIAPRDASK